MTQRTTASHAVLAVVLACQLMVGVDATVVNVALPEIQMRLHFTQTGLAWVFNAYTLAFGGLLLLGGRAGDLLGRRRMFSLGVLLFTAASLLCGLATRPWWLVAARALQGVGGALASPNVLSLIMSNHAEGPGRTRALGVFAAASSASLALGLLAGGVLTLVGSWRWVFFVNVPVGVAILVLTPVFVRETETRRGRFDLPGAVTATAGVAGLAYGVARTTASGWADPVTVAVLGVAMLLLVCFVLVEARAEQPIMPLWLFADRRRATAYVNTLLVPGTVFAVVYFLTQHLQEGLGYGPLASGLAFLPMTVVLMGVVRRVGDLIGRWGTRPVMVAGIALVVAALLWLTRLTGDSGYLADVLGPLVLLGAGAGLTTVALSVTSLSGVRAEDSGAGAGVFQTLQWTSWSLGLAVLVSVYHRASGGGVSSAFTGASVIAGLALLNALVLARRTACEASDVSAGGGG